MAETLLEDLADRIRPYVRQCPFETINQAMIDIVRDWCNWTRAYQLETNDTIQAQVADYDIDTPSANIEPIAIEYMSVDKNQCFEKTAAWLGSYVDANWRTRQANDFRFFTILTPGTFSFPCVPTNMGSPNGIYYRASYRPALSAAALDDAFWGEWLDQFAPGVLWRLKEQGGDPKPAWYDPEGAKMKRAEYLNNRGWARIRVSKNYSNTQDRFINRNGFAGRGSRWPRG